MLVPTDLFDLATPWAPEPAPAPTASRSSRRPTAACALAIAAALALQGVAAAAGGDAPRPNPDGRRNDVAIPDSPWTARGGKRAFSAQRLAAVMPEHIGEWKRVGLGTPVPSSDYEMDPVMRAQYARGNERADVEVVDLGAAGVTAAKAPMPDASAGPQTESGTAQVYQSKRRLIREEHDRETGIGSVSVNLRNGLNVRISGRGLDGSALKTLIDGVDIAGAEALRRGAR